MVTIMVPKRFASILTEHVKFLLSAEKHLNSQNPPIKSAVRRSPSWYRRQERRRLAREQNKLTPSSKETEAAISAPLQVVAAEIPTENKSLPEKVLKSCLKKESVSNSQVQETKPTSLAAIPEKKQLSPSFSDLVPGWDESSGGLKLHDYIQLLEKGEELKLIGPSLLLCDDRKRQFIDQFNYRLYVYDCFRERVNQHSFKPEFMKNLILNPHVFSNVTVLVECLLNTVAKNQIFDILTGPFSGGISFPSIYSKLKTADYIQPQVYSHDSSSSQEIKKEIQSPPVQKTVQQPEGKQQRKSSLKKQHSKNKDQAVKFGGKEVRKC